MDAARPRFRRGAAGPDGAIGPRLAASRKARDNLRFVMPGLTGHRKIHEYRPRTCGTISAGLSPNIRICKKIGRERVEIVGAAIINARSGPPSFLPAISPIGRSSSPARGRSSACRWTSSTARRTIPYVDRLLNKVRFQGGRIATIPKSKIGVRAMIETLRGGPVSRHADRPEI